MLLNDLLHEKLKGKAPIAWNETAENCFVKRYGYGIDTDSSKKAALLANQKKYVSLVLVADASARLIGAAF